MATQTISSQQTGYQQNPPQWWVFDSGGQPVAKEGDSSEWSVAPADGNELSPASLIVWRPDDAPVDSYTVHWRGYSRMVVWFMVFTGTLTVGSP